MMAVIINNSINNIIYSDEYLLKNKEKHVLTRKNQVRKILATEQELICR